MALRLSTEAEREMPGRRYGRIVAIAAISLAALVVGASAVWASSPPPGWAEEGLIKFRVLRDTRPLGIVMLRFNIKENKYKVETQTLFDYRIGPFSLYYYALRARDEWAGGELLRARGAVNDDGEIYAVDGAKDGTQFAFEGGEGALSAPLSASMPSTYWNKALVRARYLIDLQFGRLRKIEMTKVAREKIRSEARLVEADRYAMRGELDLDIWYDLRGEWVKMSFMHDGAEFNYVRIKPQPGDRDRFIAFEDVRTIEADRVRALLDELD